MFTSTQQILIVIIIGIIVIFLLYDRSENFVASPVATIATVATPATPATPSVINATDINASGKITAKTINGKSITANNFTIGNAKFDASGNLTAQNMNARNFTIGNAKFDTSGNLIVPNINATGNVISSKNIGATGSINSGKTYSVGPSTNRWIIAPMLNGTQKLLSIAPMLANGQVDLSNNFVLQSNGNQIWTNKNIDTTMNFGAAGNVNAGNAYTVGPADNKWIFNPMLNGTQKLLSIAPMLANGQPDYDNNFVLQSNGKQIWTNKNIDTTANFGAAGNVNAGNAYTVGPADNKWIFNPIKNGDQKLLSIAPMLANGQPDVANNFVLQANGNQIWTNKNIQTTSNIGAQNLILNTPSGRLATLQAIDDPNSTGILFRIISGNNRKFQDIAPSIAY